MNLNDIFRLWKADTDIIDLVKLAREEGMDFGCQ